MTTYYIVNAPSVIGEVLDGEAIIVNLDSGAYYSLRNTGGAIWNLLEKGATLSQVIDQMVRQYHGPVEAIEASVHALAYELQAEKLIVPAPQPAPQPAVSPPATPAPNGNGDRQPFQPPILEKFTDMADLLLLDPIHEVDEAAGWPQPAPAKR